jgi:hypothetical protein
MIYKLKYPSKELAIQDLIAKEVINEDLTFQLPTHAVVWIGVIVDEQGTYDEDGNELTAPIFIEGFHVDVMVDREIDFGANEIQVNNPKHKFA